MDLHIQKKSNSILNIELFCLARRFYSSVDTPVSDWFINNGFNLGEIHHNSVAHASHRETIPLRKGFGENSI